MKTLGKAIVIFIFCTILVSALLGGCGVVKTLSSMFDTEVNGSMDKPDTEVNEPSDKPDNTAAASVGNLPNELSSFTFILDGDVYSLPTSFSAFASNGWEFEDMLPGMSIMLDPNSFFSKSIQNGKYKALVQLINTSEDEKQLEDCDVCSISNYYIHDFDGIQVFEDGTELVFPGNLRIGDPAGKVKELYGEPSEFDSNNIYDHYSYYFEDSSAWENEDSYVWIITTDGIVSVLNMQNIGSNHADETNTAGNGEYAITSYKIDVQVNENNTFLITEYITAYFSVDKHGLIRLIPLRNEVVRLDGTKSSNKARISDISVKGDPFSVYDESGYKTIKIGDPDITKTGYKDYVITYTYDLGRDTGRGYDEFYFNLLGYEWDTTISNFEFSITMPKPFDKSRLGFSSGPLGSVSSKGITYDVSGNVIKGRYNGVLNAGEALTVRLELPDGYFE
jgi:hypothetical protein